MRDWRAFQNVTLAELRQAGFLDLMFCCVRESCSWAYAETLDRVAGRVGEHAALSEVARKARCRCCKQRGAHVQPCTPWGEDVEAIERVFERVRSRADRGFVYGYPDPRGRRRGG